MFKVICSISSCLAVLHTTKSTVCICIRRICTILVESPFSNPAFDLLSSSPSNKCMCANVWVFGIELIFSFFGQSTVLSGLKQERAGITNTFSGKANPGIWQPGEGGSTGFLPKLRVKCRVWQPRLHCSEVEACSQGL